MIIVNSVPVIDFDSDLQAKLEKEPSDYVWFKFDKKAVSVTSEAGQTVLRIYSKAIGQLTEIQLPESIEDLQQSCFHFKDRTFWWGALKSKQIYVVSLGKPYETIAKEAGRPFHFFEDKFFYYASHETICETTYKPGMMKFLTLPRLDQGSELLFSGLILVYRKYRFVDDQLFSCLDVYSLPKQRFIRNIPLRVLGHADINTQDTKLKITFQACWIERKETFVFDLKTGEIIS